MRIQTGQKLATHVLNARAVAVDFFAAHRTQRFALENADSHVCRLTAQSIGWVQWTTDNPVTQFIVTETKNWCVGDLMKCSECLTLNVRLAPRINSE